MYVIVITAGRGNKSRYITNSFDRFYSIDLDMMENKMIILVNDPDVEEIIFGGAIGGDTILLFYALKHRKGNRPKLTVVLPVDLKFQAQETREITKRADRIIEMKQNIFDAKCNFNNGMYKARNEEMIKRGLENGRDVRVEALWSGVKSYSGTYSTIVLAQKKYQIPVTITKFNSNNSKIKPNLSIKKRYKD